MSVTLAENRGLEKRLAQRKLLTSGLLLRREQQREGLQERTNATLIRTASSHAEADGMDTLISTPLLQSRRVILPVLDTVARNRAGLGRFLKAVPRKGRIPTNALSADSPFIPP